MKLEPELKGLDPGTVAWRAVVDVLYPRAYQPWLKREDDLLRTQFRLGCSVADIAKSHQRRPGAIYSRIRKLGLQNANRRGAWPRESLETTPSGHRNPIIGTQQRNPVAFRDLERDLQVTLGQFRPKAASAREITSFLTREISVWLEGNGFRVTREKKIRYMNLSKGSVKATGFIDLWAARDVGHRGSDVSFDQLAIEIDRTNKSRSVYKLLQAHKNGAKAVWVRWNGTVRPVPDAISVIDLTAAGNPMARYDSEYGSLPSDEEALTPIQDEGRKCHVCDRSASETANFCGFCGTKLNSQR